MREGLAGQGLSFRLCVATWVLAIGIAQAQYIHVGGFEADNEFGDITTEDMDQIRALRVLFVHKSIGDNVLEGIGGLDPMYHPVIEGLGPPYQPSDFDDPKLGEFMFASTDRYVKLTEFDNYIRNSYGGVVDIAFMKFCYPDTADTDYLDVFNDYISMLESLQAAYPEVAFVLWTSVLSEAADIDNVRRNLYSDLIRTYCSDNGCALFDIADIESTRATGEVCEFVYDSETYRRMWDDYSITDGYHPNSEEAERRLGQGLLVLLNKVADSGAANVEEWKKFLR